MENNKDINKEKEKEKDNSSDSSDNNKRLRVGGIILDGDKNLLIVLGRASGKWGIPKGGLQPNEKYLSGALREIKEETGLMLEPIMTSGLTYWSIERARLYILNVDQVMPPLKPIDTNEIVEARWLNMRDNEAIEEVLQSANRMLIAIIKKLQKILDD